MRDALKAYLSVAGSLTEMTRARAVAAARGLVQQGEATAEQVTAIAEDILSQSRANRDAISALVKYEVDRTLGRVGLASADEVAELSARVRALEAQVRRLGGPSAAAPSGTGQTSSGPSSTGPSSTGPSSTGPSSTSQSGGQAGGQPHAGPGGDVRSAAGPAPAPHDDHAVPSEVPAKAGTVGPVPVAPDPAAAGGTGSDAGRQLQTSEVTTAELDTADLEQAAAAPGPTVTTGATTTSEA